MKKARKVIVTLVFSVILLGVLAEISEAARWRYHARRNGRVTVWGTRNCFIRTRPLVYRRWMYACQTIGGYLPWYCNDWLVRHEWGPPCYNITWRKYIARPCPLSCWRQRWIMGPLDDYFVDYMPYHYGRSEVILPSLGDPNGDATGNQNIYIFVDIGDWLDAGSPYTPPPYGSEPNEVFYDFIDGNSPNLPGFTVMRVEPDMTADDVSGLIAFNPNAPASVYPFVNTRPDLLFSGRLYLLSDDSFTSEEYNGYLMTGDSNYDGVVNYLDFAQTADLWLEDSNTAGPLE